MTKKIIVVAVHPDDETLGCGGTLLKHKAQGDEIFWLICTTQTSQLTEKERQENLASVALHYAFDAVHHLNLVTTTVDTYSMSTLVSAISAIFSQVQPDTVYLPFKSDVHSDHRKIFEAAYSCTKSFRYPSIKKVLMMETLSETEFAPATKEDCFIPNVFIDISAYFDKKCAILGLYQQELGLHPFPRSIRNVTALATLRGATSGCDYAESFMLLKEIA